MTKPSKRRALQINEDMGFEWRNWKVQRFAWGLLVLVLVASALGAFGAGILNHRTVAADNITVEYAPMQRTSAETTIKVSIAARAIAAEEVGVEVNATFTEMLRFISFLPEPARSVAMPAGVRFYFSTRSGEPASIAIHVKPVSIGFGRPEIRLENGASIQLPMFVYP